MTQVISVRIPAQKVAAIDRRAADEGLDRTKYLLKLVEQDLAQRNRRLKRRFASSHLLGKFHSRGSSNAEIRRALKSRCDEDR
ncbi:MAG TPA: hypothetical protein VFE51_06490 [Verrucomicrobiae bacterium]|nr:hypothetical protein [Verrucomicrobiae bacterium]